MFIFSRPGVTVCRAVPRRDSWRGGGWSIFIYLCSHIVKTIAFGRNPSGRTRIYEYTPPKKNIIALGTALTVWHLHRIVAHDSTRNSTFPPDACKKTAIFGVSMFSSVYALKHKQRNVIKSLRTGVTFLEIKFKDKHVR